MSRIDSFLNLSPLDIIIGDSVHLQNPPFHICCCITSRFELYLQVFLVTRCRRFHQRMPTAKDTDTPTSTPCDYYKHCLCIPLIDHLLAEMDNYFSKDQMNISKLICLVPEELADSLDDSDIAMK